ncbi:MAG TPA: glycosyltransferase [Dehalococcoidia bacterium]|nr:glycosyltransferase [Dehalococcoidia bacterium]
MFVGRLAAAYRRGIVYRRSLGWRRFALRLLRVWQWAPRLLHAPWLPSSGDLGRGAVLDGSLPFGVNLCGYVSSETGLGEAARQAARALEAAGLPFVLNDIRMTEVANNELPPVLPTAANPYAFNWFCVNIADADFVAWERGEAYFRGRYNIAYWAWEMPEFPREWLSSFAYYDEIWVPSNFVLRSLAAVAPLPVVRVPYVVPPPPEEGAAGRVLVSRADLGLGEETFVFLFMFHFFSLFERKNPLGLIEAFKRAFPGREDVALVIKTAGASNARGLAEMHRAAAGAKVVIFDKVIDRAALNDLYGICDCYASLHRAEGFGLTLAEAMRAGKPAIATAYGGNCDFMDDANSYLVPARLTRLPADLGPYKKGWTWAEPDLDAAAEAMRRVYEDRDDAAARAARGRADIARLLSPESIGRSIRERLEAIARAKGLDVPSAGV